MKSSEEHDAHYRGMAIEPMMRSLENDLDAAQHTICKYVERWKVKGNGVRDLEAARDILIDYIDWVKLGTWKGKKVVDYSDVATVAEEMANAEDGVDEFAEDLDHLDIPKFLRRPQKDNAPSQP